MSCDYTVGGMFMWRDYYAVEYAIRDGVFCSRMRSADGERYYNLPIGPEGFLLKELVSVAGERGVVRFATVPEYLLPKIRENNRVVSVSEQPDFADYLYSASDPRHVPWTEVQRTAESDQSLSARGRFLVV